MDEKKTEREMGTQRPSHPMEWGQVYRPALAALPTLASAYLKWNPLLLSVGLHAVSEVQEGQCRDIAHWGNLALLTTAFARVGLLGTRITNLGTAIDVASLGIATGAAIGTAPKLTQRGPSILWQRSTPI